MLTSVHPVVNSTVDWATFTSRTREGEAMLHEAFNDMMPHLDEEPREWQWMGYYGLSGPGLACGSRADGTILRASGSWSNDIVWALPKAKDIRPSRVDLQATIKTEHYQADLAETIYNHRDDYASGRKRVPTFTLTVNTDGGATLYAGKRTSARMLRVYDKYAESKFNLEWENCWRYEVEFKGNWASGWWNDITSQKIGLEDTPAIVHRHSEDLCVPALWNRDGDGKVSFTSARVQTDQGVLEWMRAQVSPSVARLIDKGKEDEVINALFPSVHTRSKAFNALEMEVGKLGGMGNEDDEGARLWTRE